MIRLVHHHLRRGGVTRVMVMTATILRDAGERVEILAGEEPPEPLPAGVGFRLIPGMGYHDPDHPTDPGDLADRLAALYVEGDLWHIHNHGLGKNPAVTDAWLWLVERGQRAVFQPHDFAEDGRPGNFEILRRALPGFPDRLYPHAPHLRYAVLQERDRGVLASAGIPASHIHVLPNPVAPETFAPPMDPPRRILYMTRAIRRKNVGEFLYWARAKGGEMEFATSLLPENPVERKGFERWRAFAEDRGIAVTWGVGAGGRSFRDVVESADACITTSVGEGFGMSFLEPYAMGRPVCGRDLPAITVGFREDGVALDHLYRSLPVPEDAVDADFWPRAAGRVGGWRDQMGDARPVDQEALRQAWVEDGRIDFGRLDEPAQMEVIRSGVRSEVDLSFGASRESNRGAIAQAYAPERYLERIRAAYGSVGNAGAVARGEGRRVRDCFLDPAAVFLLRT